MGASQPLRLTVFLLAFFCASHVVAALYSSRDAVIVASTNSFAREVLQSSECVMVEFFAPWCGHCKNLAPEYKKAAEKLRGLAKLVAVDCDEDSNRPLCGQYQVQGFPTLKVFGENKKTPQDYQGPRTAKGIVDAIIDKLPSYVQLLTGAETDSNGKKSNYRTPMNFDSWLSKNNDTLAKAILVNKKLSTPPLFKALSAQFKDRLFLGEFRMNKEEPTVVSRLGVEDAPAVVVIPVNGDLIRYDGVMKHEGLSKFLNDYAEKKPVAEAKKDKSSKSSATSTPTEAPFDPNIAEIKTDSDLQELCIARSGICVLTFMNLEAEFKESVAEHTANMQVLGGIKKKLHDRKTSSPFSFAWINAMSPGGRKLIKDFDVSDILPNMIALAPKRKVYQPFRGGFDENSVIEFLDDLIGGRGRNLKYDFEVTLAGSSSSDSEKQKQKVILDNVVMEEKDAVEETIAAKKTEETTEACDSSADGMCAESQVTSAPTTPHSTNHHTDRDEL